MKEKIFDRFSSLILNRDGNPLSILPLTMYNWKDAIRLYFSDKITIIESYDEYIINSEKIKINLPSVVMMKEYHHFNHNVNFSKENVFLRDDYYCQFCSKDFSKDRKLLTMDHVIPRAKGGKTNFKNIVTCCSACNTKKGNKIIKPIRKPVVPSYYNLIEKRIDYPINIPHESWIKYLPWEEKELININQSEHDCIEKE